MRYGPHPSMSTRHHSHDEFSQVSPTVVPLLLPCITVSANRRTKHGRPCRGLRVCNSYEVNVQAGQTLATVLSSEAADTLSTPKSQQFGAGCVSGDVCATWQEEEGWYPTKQ